MISSTLGTSVPMVLAFPIQIENRLIQTLTISQLQVEETKERDMPFRVLNQTILFKQLKMQLIIFHAMRDLPHQRDQTIKTLDNTLKQSRRSSKHHMSRSEHLTLRAFSRPRATVLSSRG